MPDRRSKRREAVLEKEREVRAIDAELLATERQLDALASMDPEGEEAQQLRRRRGKLLQERQRQRGEAQATRREADAEDAAQAVSFADLMMLNRDLPILLLPVRLETRYFPQGGGDVRSVYLDLSRRASRRHPRTGADTG